jgi:glycosyltransferase involved in cell wall biosynthesis
MRQGLSESDADVVPSTDRSNMRGVFHTKNDGNLPRLQLVEKYSKVAEQKSLVSVIIPTYNYGSFLAECVNSVFRQSEKNIEIIIVDDGSTDNTSDVVKAFKGRVKYIFQENKGLSAARNTGLKYASGDFVQLLDSDDLLGINAIAAKANFLRQNPDVSIAVSSPNHLFSSLSADGEPIITGDWHLYRSNLDIHLAYFNIAPIHAFLVRRTAVERVGYFDESLEACEDYDYWLRAAALGYVPHYCGEGMAVYYRRHPTSMSSNLRKQYHHDALLHHVVLKVLFSDRKIQISQNHWLAFFAGLLTTLMRAELGGEPILDDLIKLFFKALQDADSSLPPVFDQLNSSGLYYLLLIRQRLRQIAVLDDARMHELGRASDRFKLRGGFAPPAPQDVFRIVQGWWHDPADARRFARTAFRILF